MRHDRAVHRVGRTRRVADLDAHPRSQLPLEIRGQLALRVVVAVNGPMRRHREAEPQEEAAG